LTPQDGAGDIHLDHKVVSAEVPHSTATNDWRPDGVVLTCGLKSCPPQIGVVIFAGPGATSNQYEIYRCTGFLIDSDKIMTNGHCDNFDSATGYFITRTDMPQKAIRKITGRVFKDFTPNPQNPELLSGHPDVAVFQLESAVGIPPLHLAQGPARSYSTLTAIVANSVPGKDALTMAIGQRDCTIHRNEAEFPFDLGELPDILTAYDCAAEKGNSGSPMFSEGSTDVEAILQGSKDLPDTIKATRASEGRDLFPYEAHDTIEGTNLRCVNYPKATANHCTIVTNDEIEKRFTAVVQSAIDGLEKPQTGFKSYVFQLKSTLPSPEEELEKFDYPTCAVTPVGSSVNFPEEVVRMDFDAWAEPQFTVLKNVQSTGAVTQKFTNAVNLKMNWAPAPGTYLFPSNDPRTQLGNSFSIALPPCSS